MSILLDAAYLTGLAAASPYLAFKALTSEKYRTGFRERLGAVAPRAGETPCTWIHAVSLGEMNLIRPLVAALAERQPDRELVLSTATNTGHAQAEKLYPGRRVAYFPLDFSWIVRKTLRRLRPDLILLVELELWPNFLAAAEHAGVPVIIVNGRISDRSFPRYRRLRPLVRRWLQRVALFCVQNETYAERLRQLGAPPERVVVTGNLKFDAALPPPVGRGMGEGARGIPGAPTLPCPEGGGKEVAEGGGGDADAAFAASFGLSPDEPLLVGGCTWPGEDEALLSAYQRLRAGFPRLRLLLAPRQADRFDAVERLIVQAGLRCVRRTVLREGPTAGLPPDAVVLLDTVGELARVYGLGTVVFVGGSLHPHGGHNIIEASGLSKPVLFGPHMDNFRDVADEFLASAAALCVADEAEFEAAACRLLADPVAAAAMGHRAREVVERNRGATRRTLDAIGQVFPPLSQERSQRR
jgi:3-deoxy-D-manno-octulosonic-acid transferase